MYMISKLHPNLKEAEKQGYNGPWPNTEAKKEMVRSFYQEKKKVKLSLNHRDLQPGGLVKPGNEIGEVCDLFIDKDNELVVKCKLSNQNRAAYQEVNGSMSEKGGKPWGVSVGIANIKDQAGIIRSRNLVHVALTQDPGFGDYHTFISHRGLHEDDIDRVILKKYGRGGADLNQLFVMGSLKNKLEGFCRKKLVTVTPMETPQQQESVDNNTMQTDNTQQQEGSFMEEENNEPLSLNQKRDKLTKWLEHIAADPRSYSKVPLETRETYLNLEKEIARDTAERNRHTARLCDEKKLSAANRDIVFDLLGANDPQGAALQSFMVDYVGANIMDREEADKRYAALELENTNLKKERDQESFNINAKRLRSQAHTSVASTPTFNHQPAKQQQTTSWSGASTNNNNNHNSTPAKSFGDQFSFLDKREGQVRKQERVDHEGLNSFMNPKMNGYQMPNEYKAPSVGVYALFQQFGGQCDQIQSKRASSATPISTTSS